MKVFELARLAETQDTAHCGPFSHVIESVGEYDEDLMFGLQISSASDNQDLEMSGMNLNDLQDYKLIEHISTLILDTLRASQKKDGETRQEILLPNDLTQHLAKDINCMSSNEPCGARGCALDLIIEDGNLCTRVGKCQVDPLTVTTFEITVVLQKDVPKWFPKLQMMLRNGSESRTVIKPTYKLVKRKLYRKESRVFVQEGS